jgi:hypothetical protein
MAEFCDPTSGSCVVSVEFDVRDGDKNSTLVGTSNLFVKCHGEPENHKLLYGHGRSALIIWEIGIAAMEKKMGKIGSLLIPQFQKYEISPPIM